METGFLFKQGILNVKTGMMTHKQFVTLTAPTTMQDVQKIYEAAFVSDLYAPLQNKSIPWLGNITNAAVQSTPLVIIQSTQYSADPIFFQLDQTLLIQDEVKVGKPCSFYLMIGTATIPFSCQTSVEYQEWIAAFNVASDLAHLTLNITASQPQFLNKWLEQLPTVQEGLAL